MNTVTVLIIGAGGRSTIYARLIKMLGGKAKVVGIAEPREAFRNAIADMHNIPVEYRFNSYEEAVELPRFADAVIIGTQDRMHVAPAVAFADKKYHIMIEKPLAPDAAGCIEIVEAAKRNNVMFSACHVMRYAHYTTVLKQIITAGSIGRIMNIDHLEPVGHWRFSHSYVRGNWSKEEDSSSLLLAKSIHDIDWISYMMSQKCTKISSFGSLTFFRRENHPADAAERCTECRLKNTCAYCAPRFYLERLKNNEVDNYLLSVTSDLTEGGIMRAMQTGPYGRCVFTCNNDVADHQVVNMEFADGATAVFSLVGCSVYRERQTRIFGTLGELECNGETIIHTDYLTGERKIIPVSLHCNQVAAKHGGGDLGVIEAFIDALRSNDPGKIISGAEVSLESHLMVFAAEKSRLTGETVYL